MAAAAALRLRASTSAPLLALAVAANALLAAALASRGASAALLVALLPVAVVAVGALVASSRALLVFAALALNVIAPPVVQPLPLPLPAKVYASDLVVGLALATWIGARLVAARGGGRQPSWPRAAVLGWPLLLFTVAVLTAAVRGHVEYGASLLGQPARLVLYAAIAFAMADLTFRQVHRGIVVVLYAGTVWMLVNAAYYLLTGGTQTQGDALSTGGTRTLSLAVSMYLSSALILALLNLELDTGAKRRALHLSIASLAAFGVILAFGRATFASLALVVLVLLVAFARIRRAVLALLPLCLPFVALAAIFVPRALPDVVPTLVDRAASTSLSDENVRWRRAAVEAVLEQAEQSPAIGVGFGKRTAFSFDGERQPVTQDAHNSFVWLLAGGGVAALGSFVLLVAVALVGAWRRFRRAVGEERVVIAWAVLSLVVFLGNAVSGPVLSSAIVLPTIWLLLLIPTVVRSDRETSPS